MPNGMNDQIPQHIAVIVDGNRRWAKERGLPVWQGHLQALDTVEQLVSWCNDAGVKYLTTYLFSTENWSRAEEELAHMFGDVFKKALGEYFPRLVQRNVKVQVLGELTRFPEAMRQIVREQVPADQISDQTIADRLYSAGMPDPDMVIRTSGEQRLSGFLLWQSAYAELYFIPVYFPALTKADFDEALRWYAGRERRYGR